MNKQLAKAIRTFLVVGAIGVTSFFVVASPLALETKPSVEAIEVTIF